MEVVLMQPSLVGIRIQGTRCGEGDAGFGEGARRGRAAYLLGRVEVYWKGLHLCAACLA